jgi:hypothetical protein
MRLLLLCMLLLVLSLSSSCFKVELPGEEEMMTVFTADTTHKLRIPPPPADVPTIATAELEDWHPICNQCHRGPHYSSYTNLNWGHRDDCLSQVACNQCHSEQLHRTHVAGDKAVCINCHLAQRLPTYCQACHSAGFVKQLGVHEPQFLAEHGKQERWQGKNCMVCHGSKQWCFDCHGIDMPHPPTMIKDHPDLVKGKPEVCANCHGEQSCTRCHKARGVAARITE